MKEVRFFYAPDAETSNELPQDEAMHATRVLRLKGGDEIMLMDGRGNFYSAEVTIAATHHCYYELKAKLPQPPQWAGHLHLAMAPTKMIDRVEWLAEKATEVGIDELSFLDCAFSERHVVKQSRIEKIVVSAVKQSRKPFMPRINEMTTFRSFVASQHQETHRYIAHCYDEIPRTDLFEALCQLPAGADALVLIGPEGDFSVGEVEEAQQAGFVSVTLGRSRLRTETAALSAVMMMQLAQRVPRIPR